MTRLLLLPRLILSRLLLWLGRCTTAGAAWVLPELIATDDADLKEVRT